MKSVLAIVLALFVSVVFAKPMESIERYNIILVHGAADSLSGMDCEASDVKETQRSGGDSQFRSKGRCGKAAQIP